MNINDIKELCKIINAYDKTLAYIDDEIYSIQKEMSLASHSLDVDASVGHLKEEYEILMAIRRLMKNE